MSREQGRQLKWLQEETEDLIRVHGELPGYVVAQW